MSNPHPLARVHPRNPPPTKHRKVRVYCGPWRAGISITAYAFQLMKFGYTKVRFHQTAEGCWFIHSYVEPVIEAAA